MVTAVSDGGRRDDPEGVHALGEMRLPGGLVLDLGRCELRRGRQRHKLTALQYRFLAACAARDGRVVWWDSLYREVYAEEPLSRTQALQLLNKLAQRLRLLGLPLLNYPGVGYRLELEGVRRSTG